ncbi:venom protease-like [Megalopta genalis]|uniref:venom protease-like n=1 Tax=Megalopta genalis TaxID=115081 RepID=UPI003FD43587
MPSFIPNIIIPRTTSDCLRMPREIPFNQKIQPIQLAGSDEARESFVDMAGYAVGWGKNRQTSSDTKALKYALLPIIGNDERGRTWQIEERNICTVGLEQNACQGDSGNPLLIIRNNVPFQVGIVSYGD